MDRISGLDTTQLLKELKKYKRYQNMTQKEIKNQIKTISDLRDELRRLESKSNKIKSPKGRLIKQNGAAFKSYIKSGYVVVDKQLVLSNAILPNEIWEEVLLNSTNLKNACLTNKYTYKLCHDKQFIKRLGFNIDNDYNIVIQYYDTVLQLADYMMKENVSISLNDPNDIKKSNIDLYNKIINMIKGKNYRFEWFNIHCKNGFYIDTSVGLEILKIPITKNEFNNIIMNMIIYHVVNFDFVKFIDGKDE